MLLYFSTMYRSPRYGVHFNPHPYHPHDSSIYRRCTTEFSGFCCGLSRNPANRGDCILQWQKKTRAFPAIESGKASLQSNSQLSGPYFFTTVMTPDSLFVIFEFIRKYPCKHPVFIGVACNAVAGFIFFISHQRVFFQAAIRFIMGFLNSFTAVIIPVYRF